jgi:hypothetical protein
MQAGWSLKVYYYQLNGLDITNRENVIIQLLVCFKKVFFSLLIGMKSDRFFLAFLFYPI